MEEDKDFKTEEWKLYEKGKNFNISMGLYQDTEDNYDFYHGKQWKNAKLGNVQPITLNIVRPTVKYKVGVLNDKLYQIVFTPNVYDTPEEGQRLEDICKVLNKYSNRIWELQQVNSKVREALKDSCINSEGILHCYEENEEIKVELIDKTNIYYGNENSSNIQEQPYIIISYRRTVDSVKEEARKYGTPEEEIEKITADSEIEEQSGRDKRVDEISPMCLVLLKYYKKNGTVWLKKSTRNAIVREEADTKLKLYPVDHMVWEEEKGYSRGNGEVKYIRANQIEINKTATRRVIAIQLCAYPKLVANMEYVSNPDSLDKVGSTIKLNKMSADDVNKVIAYLRPTTMSADALTLQQELMKDTQDLAGAGDNVNGNIDPTKASGKAILAVQENGQRPLNEQAERFKTFIEDLARIWFEMLQTYSTKGIVARQEVKDPNTGETIEVPYKISYDELQKMKFNICIEITSRAPFNKYAQQQSLDNLLAGGYITLPEYVKALESDDNMPKTKLEKILKDREETNKKMMEIEMQANALNSAMNQAMEYESKKGVQNEMSQMSNDRNVGQGNEGQQINMAMQEVQ